MSFNIGDVIVATNRIGIIIKKYLHNSEHLHDQLVFDVLWNCSFDNDDLIEPYTEWMLKNTFYTLQYIVDRNASY